MRYFMYSPLDYSEHIAFDMAYDHLQEGCIVHVTSELIDVIPVPAGQRPQAAPNTYLVRVEQDDSLRVVQKALS